MATYNVRVYVVLDLEVEGENIAAAKAMAENDAIVMMTETQSSYSNVLDWNFSEEMECYDDNGDEVDE